MARLSVHALPLVLALLLLPAAAAEFGPESPDGYPVNVDGEVVRPPAPPLFLREGDPLNKLGPLTVYPYYGLLVLELQRLAEDHPDLVKLTSAGKTTAGLDMWLLEIADFGNPAMKPLETRERVFVDGGTHSNEYSGVYFVTELAQFLLDEYETNETARWIVENRHTFLMPMVNPDGSHAFGRLNAKGVNINRNFPTLWGGQQETPVVNNPGPAPASEPETKHEIALIEALRPDYAATIHCCGNLWLYPWGLEDVAAAPDGQMLARVCDEVFAEVRESCGPIWSTIYPTSGSSTDDIYARVGSAAWAYEMSGRGRVAYWGQPVIANDVREQERESWNGILHAFLNVEKYGARPVVSAIEGDADGLRVTVTNAGWGNVTFGNLTLGGRTLALPSLAPGQSATLAFQGGFAPGSLPLRLDWEKRAMRGPQGVLDLDATLTQLPGGGLRGILPGMDAVALAEAPAADARVPGPGLLLAAVGVTVAVLARRRS